MVRVSFSLPNELDRKIRTIAKEDEATFSFMIKKAVGLVLQKYKKLGILSKRI